MRSDRVHPDAVESRTVAQLPHQHSIVHPDDYTVRPEDRTQIHAGTAFFLRGSVLALIARLCRFCRGLECFFYYLASSQDPYVADEILIPQQVVSYGSCVVDGQAVLRAGRQARACGKQVIAAGHSHGFGGVYSSGTDRDQMKELAREAVGYIQETSATVRGTVHRVSSSGARNNGKQTGHVFRADFDGQEGSVQIATERADLAPEDLVVLREHRQRRTISFFTTSNADGDHYFPAHEVHSCIECGRKQERFIEAENVCVHIVGPVEITADEEQALLDMAEHRIQATISYRSTGQCTVSDRDRRLSGDASGTGSSRSLVPTTEPAPFAIYRRNAWVASIPAAVLEEAAAKSSRLAIALGWRSKHENSK